MSSVGLVGGRVARRIVVFITTLPTRRIAHDFGFRKAGALLPPRTFYEWTINFGPLVADRLEACWLVVQSHPYAPYAPYAFGPLG